MHGLWLSNLGPRTRRGSQRTASAVVVTTSVERYFRITRLPWLPRLPRYSGLGSL